MVLNGIPPLFATDPPLPGRVNLYPGGISYVDPPFALPPERKPEATFLGGAIGLDAEGMFAVGEEKMIPIPWDAFSNLRLFEVTG